MMSRFNNFLFSGVMATVLITGCSPELFDETEVDDQSDTSYDAEVISTPESRSEWTLDASDNVDDLYLAIDSSTDTRWTTNEDQQEGQWLTIDLSRVSSFNTITLDSDESPNDFPVAYEVYISDDGDSWDDLIASGDGGDSTTVISFSDVEARYIRIEQNGSSDDYYWSIHELYVSYEDSTDVDATDSDVTDSADSDVDATVYSLEELKEAIKLSDQYIVMEEGDYIFTDLSDGDRILEFSGSNNIIDLTGVYVEVPVGSTEKASYITIEGSDNTIIGGTFEDTYYNGLTEVSDFVEYNEDADLSYGLKGDAVVDITGDNNTLDGMKLTIRGSFPYGYGSLFGIGSSNLFGLSKRCGIVVKADSTTIENVEIQQRAFCHGIYMQSPADNTYISNVLVEGRVRASNDMLAEGSDSLIVEADYLDVDGNEIEADEMHSLSEDGIRVYSGGGSVVVEDSTVKKMRGGIRLYLADSATVSNSTAIDCGNTNWNMPKGGTVTGSSGNFTNGVLSDFRLSRSSQNLELTIIASPDAVGDHNIIDIQGNSHTIVFHREDGAELDTDEERVIMVYGNNSTITNETEYAIVLDEGTSGNTVISAGEVTDYGSNDVTIVDLEL
jgi:hypothetical protein